MEESGEGVAGTYWVCWPGLLKCVACSTSWMPANRKVAAVKAPQRMMVELRKVRDPTTGSAPKMVAVSIDSIFRCCCC